MKDKKSDKKREWCQFDFKKWSAKNYITASELQNFIKSVQDKISSKPLDKIMSTGGIFDTFGEVETNQTENVSLILDEPVILFFGDIQFEILYWEESYAQIGLNTLQEGDGISLSASREKWLDISHYYSKNIIGQKIKNISVEKTDKPSSSFYRPKIEGTDDAYDEIIFEFENGAKLAIAVCLEEYMNLYEIIQEE